MIEIGILQALDEFTNTELKILIYIQLNSGMLNVTQEELAWVLKEDKSVIGKCLRKLERLGTINYQRERRPGTVGAITKDVKITLDPILLH